MPESRPCLENRCSPSHTSSNPSLSASSICSSASFSAWAWVRLSCHAPIVNMPNFMTPPGTLLGVSGQAGTTARPAWGLQGQDTSYTPRFQGGPRRRSGRRRSLSRTGSGTRNPGGRPGVPASTAGQCPLVPGGVPTTQPSCRRGPASSAPSGPGDTLRRCALPGG